MRNLFIKVLAIAITFMAYGSQIQAQSLLKGLKDAGKKAIEEKVSKATGTNSSSSSTSDSKDLNKATSTHPAVKGKTFYVSVTTGSARADGLSPSTPMKDLQKAIDAAEDNDVIYVAEGNYLGNLDRGYIECGKFANATHDRGKFISIYGGLFH